VLGDEKGKRGAQALARRGVRLVPEDRGLFRRLTVRENLRLGLPSGKRKPALLDEVLDGLPALRGLLPRRAGLLSGGEQQQLALARALLGEPKLLMVDEMSLGLAPMVAAELLRILRERATASGAGVLLVEQHVPMALGVVDRAYVLAHGRSVFSGTAAELRESPQILASLYLGGDPGDEAATGSGPGCRGRPFGSAVLLQDVDDLRRPAVAEHQLVGQLQVLVPEPLGVGPVAGAHQPDQLLVGAQRAGVVARIAPGLAGPDRRLGLAKDDLVHHPRHQGEGLVARQLDQPQVEAGAVDRELLGVVDAGAAVLQLLGQRLIPFLVAVGRQQPRRGWLDRAARHVHVAERGLSQLKLEPCRAGHRLVTGDADPGPGTRAAAQLDQALGLQYPERLAERGAGDPEVLHQRRLVRQEVAVGERALNDPASQPARDQLARLGRPDPVGRRCAGRAAPYP
jgi:branched-chain amino acid transport system ATP-binding protein